jgi:hypothetical protein
MGKALRSIFEISKFTIDEIIRKINFYFFFWPLFPYFGDKQRSPKDGP